MKLFLEIFMVFFKIGLFTFGGGYAMLPIIQKEVVENKGWMSDEEFLDAISLTNSLPGPLAINAATFTGYRVYKAKGSFAALLGAALPSIIVITLIAMVFDDLTQLTVVKNIFNAVRPAVVALIIYSVIKLARSAKIKEYFSWILTLLAIGAVIFLDLHPIFIIIVSASYGIFVRGHVVKAVDSRKAGKEAK
ncbi:MAG: chromate transporter [Firmicutes bacterium]|nr:chromate transporter [Bacillota bacterium]